MRVLDGVLEGIDTLFCLNLQKLLFTCLDRKDITTHLVIFPRLGSGALLYSHPIL
jgi:hypothetical protein